MISIVVKCLICNIEKQFSIVEHLKHTHKLSVPQYRLQFSDAIVKSKEYSEIISQQWKVQWKDKNFQQKMSNLRKITHNTEKFHINQSNALKKYYSNGGKNWNVGLTKNDDVRLKHIGELNSKHLTGRTKELYPYLARPNLKFNNHYSEWSEERKNEWKLKISETLAKKYANGDFDVCHTNLHFKQGTFITSNNTFEYYHSGWEEQIMFYLESLLNEKKILSWTKKHKIIIDYVLHDTCKKYIPDFLILFNDNSRLLLEIKGRFDEEELQAKKSAAKLLFGEQYKIAFSVNEAKEIINEILEN